MPELTYNQDGLSTIHTADFLRDDRFRRAIARGAEVHQPIPIEWRIHVVTWAAEHCMKIEGDFIECGVNRGFTSAAVMEYVDWNRTHGARAYYLMDTFNGLVDDLVSDREKKLGRIEEFKSHYPECYEITKSSFASFENVHLIRGVIPGTLSQNPATKVAFMHIDMNCAAPEIAAMRHFWPKMTGGGMVVLDDYAYHGYQPQKDAMDELGRELGFSVLSLPTGGGLIVKPPQAVPTDKPWWSRLF